MTTRSRPRVLIENGDVAAANSQADALRAAGFDPVVCHGPDRHGDDDCPLLRGDRCGAVDEADVLVHDLDLGNDMDRAVLRGIRRHYPQLPIVVEATTHAARQATGDLDELTVVVPYSMEHLVGAVADALASA